MVNHYSTNMATRCGYKHYASTRLWNIYD